MADSESLSPEERDKLLADIERNWGIPRAKIEKSLPATFGSTLDEALAGYRDIVNREMREEAGELAEEIAEEKSERLRRVLADLRDYERAVQVGRAVNTWDWKHWLSLAVAVAALVVGILALALD